ncbi:hypothetical protein Thimo_1473 [Thioflavicoccus mobilis 8321]|uniref:DUF1820 domain-containing protein n=1 Tax=Thioflavicoccus mobilis 8321 TaxID=765912 RepID=L0GU19_9GAMM|nr:DUF1820 family protein [Thioflavicoccus mobilis]AGA90263.1 hypothetical protein Thimo_1473 [Thioflavicoccus mobilis 8321]
MRVFRVAFFNQGKVYEVYARRVRQSELYGFIEIEEILFGEASSVLVDPAEERLKTEFKGVQRSMIPIHAVVRIDEVAKEGTGKIHEVGERSNVTPFPSPSLYAPSKDKDT